MATPAHYRGDYDRRARLVVGRAKRNPLTRCWRCGLTLAEIRELHPKRRITWTAGHTVDADSSKPILPEHSYCNFKAGQAHGESTKMRHSKRWAGVL